MSKRQSNTLFNYFQSSPQTKKPNGTSPSTTPKIEKGDCSTPSTSSKNRKSIAATPLKADSDEDEIVIPKKRSRIQVMSDSSEDENESVKPSNKRHKSRDSSSSENENSTPNKPKIASKKSKARVDSNKVQTKKALLEYKYNKEEKKEIPSTSKPVQSSSLEEGFTWKHNTLAFLQPENIRDANKRGINDPDYDPKTLYVPESYLQSLTPAMRQWWELKSKHFDSVLFFKVGKFYELYHMDAVIGVTQLGFTYMKGDFAHSGFPETAYGKMANMLIQKGYKVARCEQTETPEMMEKRCKSMTKPTKFDKVVKREICQISAKGSTVYTAQLSEAYNDLPYYMYAISTKLLSGGTIRIGVCFVETTLGTFYLSEFTDDKHFSKLLALLAEFPAAMILTERRVSSSCLSELLNTQFKDTRKYSLLSKKQFFTASGTLEKLATACYFRNKEGDFQWPELFKQIADDCMPKQHAELALSALGACLWYMIDSKIDIQVFSLGNFQWYDPLEFTTSKTSDKKDCLILDAVTITNLHLLASKDSLQKTLDHCDTAFGKRLLHRWICRPLCNVDKIRERQKAITALLNDYTVLQNAKNVLKHVIDLERQLTKIHHYGNRFLVKNHPDSRAILYEESRYSKRKIKDLVKTLKTFEKLQEIPEIFKDCDDWLLRKITQFEPRGVNINLSNILEHLRDAFNSEQAEKEGIIIPSKGVIKEYDDIEKTIENINGELDEYLREQSKFFGCKCTYFGTDKRRFQIEVPTHRADKATSDYQLEGAKKTAKRYSTSRTRELLAAMMHAETERRKIILDLNRRIFETFSQENENFNQVVQCTAILDVICSLAEYARTFSQDICLPEVLPFNDQPFIAIENGRHPCIPNIDSFVPNDTTLGDETNPSLMLLTGPNMGGKSTLMRQVLVIAIMAQIGSYVPASSCKLSLVDRIFTRLGAKDDIIRGQSTFHVELSEAGAILHHATKHSLVLVDELGRGTSTHDGNAIATAYVRKLCTIGCRSMFATHYHTLVDNFIGRKDIQLGHMACMVENDDDPALESITFLYKLARGKCPKSYGFNAARLAGLDRRIIKLGRKVASELEKEANLRQVFQQVFTADNLALVRRALASMVI